jgi:alcohol dehydrogenase class IV
MTTTKQRLTHAIEAYTSTPSAVHAASLNAVIDGLCSELDMLRMRTEHQSETLITCADTIDRLRARPMAQDDAIKALRELIEAYRARTGIDGAWDEPAVRAERVVIAWDHAQSAMTPLSQPPVFTGDIVNVSKDLNHG